MARKQNEFEQGLSNLENMFQNFAGGGGIGRMITIGAGILFLLWAVKQSVVTIPAGHRGVQIDFGAVQETILDEGLHFVVPIMTKVEKMSVQIQKNEIKTSASSKDLQTVHSSVVINWHLPTKDLNKLFQEIGTIRRLVTTILEPAVDEVFKAITAKYSAEEILTLRGELKETVDQSLRDRLEKYRIVVRDVSLVDIDFSREFNKAIESKQIAEQDAKKARYVADQALEEAEAEINTARGKAEAQRLINKTIDKKILLQQAIQKWDGRFPEIMVDEGMVPFINIPAAGGSSKR